MGEIADAVNKSAQEQKAKQGGVAEAISAVMGPYAMIMIAIVIGIIIIVVVVIIFHWRYLSYARYIIASCI